MASKKQIAWRKKFAKLYGKKKKGSKSTKSTKSIKDLKGIKSMTQDQKTAEIEKDVRQHMKWKDAKRKYGYGTVDLLQFYFAVSPRMAKTLGLPKTPPKYGQSPAY